MQAIMENRETKGKVHDKIVNCWGRCAAGADDDAERENPKENEIRKLESMKPRNGQALLCSYWVLLMLRVMLVVVVVPGEGKALQHLNHRRRPKTPLHTSLLLYGLRYLR